jgi:acetyl-CoA carboxylase carboxyltransferase component
VIRSAVKSARLAAKAREGDGVIGAYGAVRGRPVFCFAQDQSFTGGSLGEAHADTIVRVMRLALEARAPVVSFVESAGARLHDGAAALAGYARVFRANVAMSGRIPQISVITGTSAGGGCYSPALTDFVLMTRKARMFLTGPEVVRKAMGETIDAEQLGGPQVHTRNGVCHLLLEHDSEAVALVTDLLGYLPQNAWEAPPVREPRGAIGGDPEEFAPRETRRVYDVRDVVRRIVDAGELLEISPTWARNIVVGFARLDGAPIGVIANQPRYLGGVLDAAASAKGARFVRTCNAYGIPLIVLVDTPGFMPGSRHESGGIIRHGAKLLYAFTEAHVPKLTVILRQAYGGGYITMNSKDLGADFVFAWPRATIGIMGAREAAGILYRRDLAAADDPEAELDRVSEAYMTEHQAATASAHNGVIDEVVEPADTRVRLSATLAVLRHKGAQRPLLGNIPL